MTTEHHNRTPEKKKPDLKVRDLKAKEDPKGGKADAKKDEKRPASRTGEIDFMKGFDNDHAT